MTTATKKKGCTEFQQQVLTVLRKHLGRNHYAQTTGADNMSWGWATGGFLPRETSETFNKRQHERLLKIQEAMKKFPGVKVRLTDGGGRWDCWEYFRATCPPVPGIVKPRKRTARQIEFHRRLRELKLPDYWNHRLWKGHHVRYQFRWDADDAQAGAMPFGMLRDWLLENDALITWEHEYVGTYYHAIITATYS